MKIIAIITLSLTLLSCGGTPNNSASASTTKQVDKPAAPTTTTAQIIGRTPHPTDSYTQGLLVHNGKLYESTGMYGKSKLRRIDIATGRIEKELALPSHLFGEGLTIHNQKLYQLTWQEGVCRVYDLDFKLLETLRYTGEGWGIVSLGEELYMSNGSSIIQVKDPKTLRTNRQFQVHDHRGAVGLINEMEVIDSLVYANIYMSPIVVAFDPKDGKVIKYIDCANLEMGLKSKNGIDVLNGIAHDTKTGKTYLTGKLWDTLFEVKF